jgi:single-stranded-DNA-specific exonuclease
MSLHSLNFKRQELTEKMLAEGLVDAQKQIADHKKLLFVVKEGWSEGIVGLVAGRLNERYYLPVLAASIKNGVVKGSARSIKGFDIITAITKAGEFLDKFGGHNQAAGFTLQEKNLQFFCDKIQEVAFQELTESMILKSLEIEAELSGKEIEPGFVEELEKFKPFGFGNAEPYFAIKNVTISDAPRLMGAQAQHIKFNVMTEDDVILEVIAFNQAQKYSPMLELNKRYDMAGTLAINEWRGNKIVQFKLKDLINVDEKSG